MASYIVTLLVKFTDRKAIEYIDNNCKLTHSESAVKSNHQDTTVYGYDAVKHFI